MTYQLKTLEDLKPAPYNPREITPEAAAGLSASVAQFGDISGIVWNKRSGHLVSGHQRLEALTACGGAFKTDPPRIVLGDESFAVRVVDWDAPTEKAANVAANNPHIAGAFTDDLQGILASLQDDVPAFDELRLDLLLEDNESGGQAVSGTLADTFGVPPCSILDARQGYWQERKRVWRSIGISSKDGRGSDLLGFKGGIAEAARGPSLSGTSEFDSVLCEILISWFSFPGAVVLDPFAGGSTRGIVSAVLGRQYVGIDLCHDQVRANEKQWRSINLTPSLSAAGGAPDWRVGDSREVVQSLDIEADFILSCPPYSDLEVYSDDPRDISNMIYTEFLESYRAIIKDTCAKLKEDRFACFVVGEIRDKKTGLYRNFVGDTIEAFRDTGLAFYNEIILVLALSTLPLRTRRSFSAARKVGKCHQNVLVFVKGDPKRATEACGEVDLSFLDKMEAEEEGTP